VNGIILGVRSLQRDLEDHDIEIRYDLAPALPLIPGHRRQLEEVVFNLVHNAIEAMDATTCHSRVLQVSTKRGGAKLAG
jgi:nitrogen-specific signal transduction histidine kinase